MNTNITITLDEEQRRQVSRNMFGSNRPVTRKELNLLVATFMEHITDERMLDLQTLQPQPALEQHAGVHAGRMPVHTEPCPRGADPKRWDDASYRRGWTAVGQITRRMR